MKNNSRSVYTAFMLLLTLGLFMSGCVEHRYYRQHHEHSPEYNHRHQNHH